MSNRTIRSFFRFLTAVAVGVICAAALTIALTIWWLRSDAIASALRNSSNLAEVLASQTASSIQSIDLILTEIKGEEEIRSAQMPDDFDHVIDGEGTYQFLVERLSHLPQAEFIALVDKNGTLAASTLTRSPIDLSDRAYFGHFKNNDDKGIYISDALISRTQGIPIVLFSKRINDANNAFLGVAVVGVRLTYFQRIYESIASLPGQSFVLLHRDGAIIVRYPDFKDRVYKNIPAKSPWHRLVSQGGGTYRLPDYIDGEARLAAVRPLRDYPLVVNVGVSETAALSTWRIQAIAIGAGTLLAMFCSLFLLNALSRQFRSLEMSEGALVKKTTELQRAKATVDAALNNIMQGLMMFDSTARLIVCNQRYIDMYGLSRDIVRPGSTLQKIVEHRAAVGCFGTDDVTQYVADIVAAMEQGTLFDRTTNLRDGRTIHIVSKPIDGDGWVTTHDDVTDAKRAEERISHLAQHDVLTGLANRKLFYVQLEQAFKRVGRGERLAVLYLDVDQFKRTNDTLGHSAGDKLLKGVADRLRRCIRDIDVVARLSGDEFAIIQSSLSQNSDAAVLATRVREAIREPFDLDGNQVVVYISIGISIAPDDANQFDELL